MQKDVFDHLSYTKYLMAVLKAQPSGGHGFRQKIARAANCQASLVSQVLNGHSHFNLEQAEAINALLEHSDEEADFFLALVQLERASTPPLRKRFKKQIEATLSRRLVLKDRVDIKETVPKEDQPTYYSSWLYAAVHLLSTMKAYQRKEAIASYLKVPLTRVGQITDFLASVGLIKSEKGILTAGNARLWLGRDSPMLPKHHTNWRLRAIDSLDRNSESDIHYSALVSLSSDDLAQIKEKIVKNIEATRAQIKESKNENEIHCFAVDFFKV